MKKCLPFIFLWVCLSAALHAQFRYLYPVKVNHKWGYIDRSGKVVVEPRYDALGPADLPWYGDYRTNRPSGFRLVELNGLLGLVGPDRKEALAPLYRQIRVLSYNHFAVKKGDQFVLVDRTGRELFGSGYEDIRLLDTLETQTAGYFKVGKNALWGVQSATGEFILPIQYEWISLLRTGSPFFKAKAPGKNWQLLKKGGNPVLPGYYLDIKAHHPDFIAAQTNPGSWSVFDSTGRPLSANPWVAIQPLNGHFLELWDSTRYTPRLYRFDRRDTFSFPNKIYLDFHPLNSGYIACNLPAGTGILDSLGTEVLRPAYDSIAPGIGTVFRVKNRFWGLVDLARKDTVLACEYARIFDFRNGLAIVIRNRNYGMVNRKMEQIIPPMYDLIQQDSQYIKAFRQDSVSLFRVDSTGKVVDVQDYGQVFNLRIGYEDDLPIKEAVRKKPPPRPAEISYVDQFPSYGVPESKWLWAFDNKSTRSWGLKETQKSRDTFWVLPPVYRQVSHILEPGLSLVFSKEQFVVNQFTETVGVGDDRLCQFSIFSHNDGQMITPFKWIGLRRHDFERGLPLAVFIDQDGKFGLAGRNGQEKKNKAGESLRFSYIGEFVNGVAVAAVAGRLQPVKDPNQLKFQLETIYNLARKYCLSSVSNQTWRETPLCLDAGEGSQPEWGFIDTSGNWVIRPQYDFLEYFDGNGRAEAMKDGEWGVIDRNNNIVIPFSYLGISGFYGNWKTTEKGQKTLIFNQKGWEVFNRDYTRRGDFKAGFCRVMQDSLWGFINETGEEILPCRFKKVHDFSEGLVAVLLDDHWIFMDTTGNQVFSTADAGMTIDTVYNFHSGRCLFKSRYKYGFLDRKGNVKIEPVYVKAFDFSHGVARVVMKSRTGLINTEGETVLKPERFERIYPFNELGLAVAMESFRSGMKCLVDNRGAVLSPVKYQEIGPFKAGFAVVKSGKLYGLVNRRGKEVIPVAFDRLGELSEGLIAARGVNKRTWVYLDTTGAQAFEGAFDWVSPFSDSLALVQVENFDDKSRKMINRLGKTVPMGVGHILFYENGIFGIRDNRPPDKNLPCFYAGQDEKNLFDRHFQEINAFENGVAMVKLSWRQGLINRNGMTVIPTKYAAIDPTGSLFITRPPAFGVLKADGTPLIPAHFDQIDLMDGNIFRVELGEKIGYINRNGRWLWELRN